MFDEICGLTLADVCFVSGGKRRMKFVRWIAGGFVLMLSGLDFDVLPMSRHVVGMKPKASKFCP